MNIRCLCGLILLTAPLLTSPAAPILNSESPAGFFTNAADRMLRYSTEQWRTQNFTAYTNTFGVTTTGAFGCGNIPVYVGSRFVYTPAVNRLLQLAANVYDASTTNYYPSVFRPLFTATAAGDLFITGYTNVSSVTGLSDIAFSLPFDAAIVADAGGTNVPVNVYGVPWIIGTKKGFPNFNEFSMVNNLTVTRRLQLTRITNASPLIAPTITGTNQMYLMSLNSSLGVELWNSYASNYPGTVVIGLNESASLTITNDDPGFQAHPGIIQPMFFSTNVSFTVNFWPGSGAVPWLNGNPNPASFRLPLNITMTMLTNAVYRSPYAGGVTVPPGLAAPCLIPIN